jgi:hypothetical protein
MLLTTTTRPKQQPSAVGHVAHTLCTIPSVRSVNQTGCGVELVPNFAFNVQFGMLYFLSQYCFDDTFDCYQPVFQ